VRGWLVNQLEVPDPLLSGAGPSTAYGLLVANPDAEALKTFPRFPYGEADLFWEQMNAAVQYAITTYLPLRERLVWFWSNHFTISARAGNYTFGLAGAYIREAIRPHVTGRFADMLKAVMQHPGMLTYLDNWSSNGPESPLARAKGGGLNENLARECLELHTLGVKGGYSQGDVTAFAGILSGRTMEPVGAARGFLFKNQAHDPGPKRFMGHEFPGDFAGSEAALDFIADHPATHQHIAAKLVTHFIGDVPPAACVADVAAVLDNGGDLKRALITIIDRAEAWLPLAKFRTPGEYVVAVQRALDLPLEPGFALLYANIDLGQEFLSPLLPNGWPDTEADWLTGEAILKRADWAMTQASRPGAPSAEAVADATLGDRCSASTRAAMKAAATPAEALATLLVSPEFLRR
jgi:uncharacterized protein (DUF1800 family)